jgi:hypothetical protein
MPLPETKSAQILWSLSYNPESGMSWICPPRLSQRLFGSKFQLCSHTLSKRIEGDKNTRSIALVKNLVTHYQPGVMLLQDTSTKNARRAPRIRALSKRIIALATSSKVSVKLFTFEKVRQAFFADGKGPNTRLLKSLPNGFQNNWALAYRLNAARG